ncbi:hypothetical protein VP1G_10843 [Cytospora mali]|uniref:Uncharacterized protein n=1 Tax=Cytospora mali TaxID=578113 RepID=A0A194UX80_CYTMA|nr:hypothetical protein VP1G_10843 [Valsa mali var. pyri (nom. inval.)]
MMLTMRRIHDKPAKCCLRHLFIEPVANTFPDADIIVNRDKNIPTSDPDPPFCNLVATIPP